MRMKKANSYSTFISYRHKPLDIEAAKAIHSSLENYAIPAGIKKKTGIKKIGRCFRDREELPTSSDLAQNITEALESSEWLIVVCTPDTPHSKWCRAEIETFIKLHGRSRVLAVLAAGEPGESFPDILRFETTPDGTVIEREPLAADIRAENVYAMKRKLRVEKLRLLAPVLGVAFDDLRRRARERRIRLTLTTVGAAFLLMALFTGYALNRAAVISQQNGEIIQVNSNLEQQIIETNRQRDAALINQSQFLAEQSTTQTQTGDRMIGALLALEALPEDAQNPDRPYTQAAHGALFEALYSEAPGQTVIGTVGPVALSKDGRRFVTAIRQDDGSELAGVWNLTGECVVPFSFNEPGYVTDIALNVDASLAAVTIGEPFAGTIAEKRISIMDTLTGAEVSSFSLDEFTDAIMITGLDFLGGQNLLISHDYEKAVVIDFITGTVINEYDNHAEPREISDDKSKMIQITESDEDSEYIFNVCDTLTGEQFYIINVGVGDNYTDVTFRADAHFTGADKYITGTGRFYDPDANENRSFCYTRDAAAGEDGLVISYETAAGYYTYTEISPDGTIFAMGHSDGSVGVYNLETKEWGNSLMGHSGAVTFLKYSADGNTLLSSSDEDGTVCIWDLTDKDASKPIAVLNPWDEQKSVLEFVLASDTLDTVIAFDNYKNAKIYNFNQTLGRAVRGQHGEVPEISYTPDGSAILAWNNSGVYRYDAVTLENTMTFTDDNAGRFWLSQDGSLFALIDFTEEPYAIAVFDSATGDEAARCYPPPLNGEPDGEILAYDLDIEFSPNGRDIYFSDERFGETLVWEARTGKFLTFVPDMPFFFNEAGLALARVQTPWYDPDGYLKSSARLYLFDYDSFEVLWDAEIADAGILGVYDFYLNGDSSVLNFKRVVEGTGFSYNLKTGELTESPVFVPKPLSAAEEQAVFIWEALTGKEYEESLYDEVRYGITLPELNLYIMDTLGEDSDPLPGNLELWSLSDRRRLASLPMDDIGILNYAVSLDRKELLVSDASGGIRSFNLDLETLKEEARAMLGSRTLTESERIKFFCAEE
jgi:WD40 repeat protein